MMSLKSKKVLIYDFGLFSEIGVRLAKDFGEVLYYCPWEDAFPKSNKSLVGCGLEGVERVQSFEDHIDSVDMLLFPDTHCASKVEFYKSQGYAVAGVGYAEELELNRWKAREIQKEVGLPTQATELVIGIDNLRDYLQANEDKFVKINIFRGDIESFYHEDYESSEPLITKLAFEFGPKGKTMQFVVEDRIDGIEPGLDAIVFNGRAMSPTMVGYEIKGGGYIAKVFNLDDVPKSLKNVQDKLAPVLAEYHYNFFFSTEIRVPNKNDGYLIDLCCRMAAPVPNALQQEMIENYSEVIWGLATGEVVVPKFKSKFGAGAAFSTEWSDVQKGWTKITFPEEMRQWIKFRAGYRDEDDRCYYAVPGFPTVCSIVALGNTVDEATKKVQERAEEVKGYLLDKSSADFTDVIKEVDEGESYGYRFR